MANARWRIQKQHVPDVVLIDIGMPIMDGYEVARRLRSEAGGREVTVIAVSGFSQSMYERGAEEAAIDLHVTKPVDLDELERALARVAGRARHSTSEPEAQMMFNSPLQNCPVVKEYVALDQTQHQCAVEQRCEATLRCPLHALSGGTSPEASEGGAGTTPAKQSTLTEGRP